MYRKLILAILLVSSANQQVAHGQKVQHINVADLEKLLSKKENNLYVINFWATWCAPCVEELPAFVEASRVFEKSGVTFVFVSLDFPSRIDKQLIPFLKKNKIEHEVAVMMETDANLWIDKVDTSWEGNIPATLFINNHKNTRYFHPEALNAEELRKLITQYM